MEVEEEMRTDQEILDRIEQVKGEDWLGTRVGELVTRLSFDAAKPLLKDDTKREEWKVFFRDRDTILKEMLEYMEFAWGKAINCRGISASRSIEHYEEWIWLLGDDPKKLPDYEHYGKEILKFICQKYGWDALKWDDGVRVNSESELYA